MVLVNLTEEQIQILTQPQDIISQIFTQPYIWVVISLIIIFLIISRFKGKTKADPSTKAWWGREVRADIIKKETKKRMETFGRKMKKVSIEKGLVKIGVVRKIEYDKELFAVKITDPKTKRSYYKPSFWYRVDRLQFRNYGFVAWLKSLLGLGLQNLVITPDAYKIERGTKGRRIIQVDPTVHIINDSNVWTLADERAIESNYNLILKAHDENIHGSDIDFLRRLAVHSSSVASSLEKLSHEAKIREEERKAKTSPYM